MTIADGGVNHSELSVTLTEPAAVKMLAALEAENISAQEGGIRIQLTPGGCSGFQYELKAAPQAEHDDFVIESRGARIFVDPFSAQYLHGLEIDYVEELAGAGFKFNNPNSHGGCGCGKSDSF